MDGYLTGIVYRPLNNDPDPKKDTYLKILTRSDSRGDFYQTTHCGFPSLPPSIQKQLLTKHNKF